MHQPALRRASLLPLIAALALAACAALASGASWWTNGRSRPTAIFTAWLRLDATTSASTASSASSGHCARASSWEAARPSRPSVTTGVAPNPSRSDSVSARARSSHTSASRTASSNPGGAHHRHVDGANAPFTAYSDSK